MEQQEKTYEAPKVIDYGKLVDLTQAGGQPNSDVPGGPDNTAYSPAT